MAASMTLPERLSEAEYVGALAGEALEVVRCETNGLCVPASVEIVFEGMCSVKETGAEGPFGEMYGWVYSFFLAPIE